MKKLFLFLTGLAVMACSTEMKTPKDELVKRLSALAGNGQIAYGHQDDLAYGHAWCVEDWENDALERSDVKAVAGKYPAMVGFDLGDIEHGADKNLDGVPFGLIRKAALAHIGRGGMVTFSWHPDNILTGGDAWDVSSNQVVASVLPGGEKHEEFMGWLQRAADFIESLGDVAIIFRPWHESSGNWFWWCQNVCSVGEYKALFRMTYAYFVQERGLTNLLWCYSPNGPFTEEGYMERYPGDDIIDILGADFYEFAGPGGLEVSGAFYQRILRDMLARLTALGQDHGKFIGLSETGMEGIPDTHWWCGVLYPVIQDYPVTYVLTWRNAHDRPGHFYGPWEGYAGEEDFKAFAAQDKIRLLD